MSDLQRRMGEASRWHVTEKSPQTTTWRFGRPSALNAQFANSYSPALYPASLSSSHGRSNLTLVFCSLSSLSKCSQSASLPSLESIVAFTLRRLKTIPLILKWINLHDGLGCIFWKWLVWGFSVSSHVEFLRLVIETC